MLQWAIDAERRASSLTFCYGLLSGETRCSRLLRPVVCAPGGLCARWFVRPVVCAPPSFLLLLFSLMLAAPHAHAGTYVWTGTDPNTHLPIQSPAYSGGLASINPATPSGSTTAYYPSASTPPTYGATLSDLGSRDAQGNYAPMLLTGKGDITAKFTWQPAYPGEPAPANVIVQQHCVTGWGGYLGGTVPPTCSGGNGLGLSSKATSANLDTTQYKMQSPVADGSVSLTCSPSVSMSGDPPSGSSSLITFGISYSATVTPVTINLGGTTTDSSGNQHILIGQQCQATLSGIPAGCTASNIQWSVSGWTVQGNSWAVSADHTKATFPGPNAAYTYTQATQSAAGPSWYWDDLAGPQTVTCTATVTPPSGQGTPFPITAKQIVTLDVPTYTNNEVPGAVELDAKYQALSGINLHAGADGDNIPGIFFYDTVTTPIPPYSSTGTWYRIQLVSVSRYETALATGKVVGAPGNTIAGALDVQPGTGAYIYNSQIINADGTTYDPHHNNVAENDSPGFQVFDMYSEYQVKNELYQDYIMYTPPPPVGNSITVPLFYYQWSWNADAKIPPTPLPKSWSNWNGAPTGGTITTPGSGSTQRMLIYPTWSSFVSAQLP